MTDLSRSRWRWPRPLQDVRIAAKLAMILTLPILAVLALAGYAVSITGVQAARAQQLRQLTILAGEAGDLAYALELERAAAAQALQAGRVGTRLNDYLGRSRATDEAIAAYRLRRVEVTAPPNVAPVLLSIGRQLDQLVALRSQVEAANLALSVALLRYRILIADLLTYRQAIAQSGASSGIADQIRAAAALSTAIEFIGQQQTAVLRALAGDRLTPSALQEIVATRTGYTDSVLTFNLLARPEWRDTFHRTVTGDAVIAAQRLEGSVARTNANSPLVLDSDAWVSATTAKMDLIRSVQTRVEADVLAAVTAERDGQMRVTIGTSGGVVLVLMLVILLALWVARSMARSLTRLREGALIVSRERLPQAVARLQDERSLGSLTPEQIAEQSGDPVQVRGSDEIGQVAAAFNVVHREAVRIAAQQAQMRISVAALFVSLGRRLQGMVDLLISRLDTFEKDEQDPTRLQQLFDIDHLATRMTRYTESLLVLSGTPFARTHPRPVELLETLRAAVSKVERYVQIDIGVVDEGVAVVAYAADHVVHALAELMDNATAYSPPTSPVIVEARRLSDRVVVEIVDAGVGLSEPQRTRLNDRLATPPPVDPEALRATGLVVVAHLAAWHGMVVRLHHRRGGGTVAEATLPSSLLETTGRHRRDGPAFGMPPIVPRLLDRPHDQRIPAAAGAPGPTVGAGAQTSQMAPWMTHVTTQMNVVSAPNWGLSGAGGPQTTSAAPRAGFEGWRAGAADEGWLAAKTAATPAPDGQTPHGLPKRKPMAQLVPGAVAGNAPAAVRRDPSAVAAAMSFYRRGLETARAHTSPSQPAQAREQQ